MKHLKFFEQLYSEITQDESSDKGAFDNTIKSNSEDFTEKEINDIRDILIDLIYDHVENDGSCRALFHSSDFTKGFYISKMKDEWFYVYNYSNGQRQRYKCDQFDGLLELLNKLK